MKQNELVLQLLAAMDRLKKMQRHRSGTQHLPQGEYIMLLSIHRHDPVGQKGITVSDLSTNLCITKPAISQTVNLLEQKGLVERRPDSHDRRVVRVHITNAGQELLMQAHLGFHTQITAIVERLGEVDTKELIRLIVRLSDILDELQKEQKQQGEQQI